MVTACYPDGQVRVQGEIWAARCEENAAPGDRVVVDGLDGITLRVRRVGTPSAAYRGPEGPIIVPVTRVAFLGPPGTFTEEALLSDPDLAAGELVAIDSIPEVVAAVERGEADCGVVPVENSIEGSVNVTLDLLAFESDLLIQGEIVRPISLSLLARPGTKLKDVRTVISFPTATAQCRDWLDRRLPKAEVAAANSTAGAAEQVARSRAQGMAAIGTQLAGELYGLEALASDIEDHPENATRFLVVGRGVPAPTAYDKTTIVCYQRRNQPGSLVSILQEFAARSINLTRLESRPTKEGLGSYCFVIDCEGHVTDELVGDVLRNLAAKQGGREVPRLLPRPPRRRQARRAGTRPARPGARPFAGSRSCGPGSARTTGRTGGEPRLLGRHALVRHERLVRDGHELGEERLDRLRVAADLVLRSLRVSQ